MTLYYAVFYKKNKNLSMAILPLIILFSKGICCNSDINNDVGEKIKV